MTRYHLARHKQNAYWDVMANDWCIGWLMQSNGKIFGNISGHNFGEKTSLREQTFINVDEGFQAIVKVFKERISCPTSP